jgi:DNA-binding transcriptional MerR regulator
MVYALPATQGRQTKHEANDYKSRTADKCTGEKDFGWKMMNSVAIATHGDAQKGREGPSYFASPRLHSARVFGSEDVARFAGITLRQLQWWDERQIVSPRQEGHRRVYSSEQVLEILTVAALRQKGLSLQKIRWVLRLLRSSTGQPFKDALNAESPQYVLTDGNSVFIEKEAERVAQRIVNAIKPVYVLNLTEEVKRFNSATR